jgi:PKD repeat protein
MFRKLPILLLAIICFSNAQAQCVLVPLSLEERVNASSLIVEAQVGSKSSYMNPEGNMIFTANTLNISKVYKGAHLLSSNSLVVITLGGQVGLEILKVDPELELETGAIGIFLLIQNDGQWVAHSGPQGFINIDKQTAIANDVFNTWPANTVQNQIVQLTGNPVVDINANLTKIIINRKRISPVITSFSPSTITAGTTSLLTIKGSNFETLKDTNSVQFKNADDGGKSYIKALKYDYISWSDTMIELIVRTTAGTGPIRIVTSNNGDVVSNDTLTVSYAHLNAVLGDSIGYETRHISLNNNNGLTWKMNRDFYDSTNAKGAFIRSLERWRCGTYFNWDTSGVLNFSAIKRDNVSMCAWDTNNNMSAGVLAQCFSWWSGCIVSGKVNYFVSELDIRFIKKPTSKTTWNYSTGSATINQFHFESVATHELGHGHQLGHVINSAVVMHYSIANGQVKPNLTANDIAGGDYVINKSASSVCGRGGHAKLNSGNCAIVAPAADFSSSANTVCLNDNVTFSDSSKGNISAYAWNFGANASPATANTKGPHVVNYSGPGIKTISLTITTSGGNKVKNKAIEVKSEENVNTDFSFVAAEKGNVTFTNNSKNPTSAKWYFGDGDSSSNISPVHQYKTGGTYNITLSSANTCNSKDSSKNIKFAYLDFTANPDPACINQTVVYSDSSDNSVVSWTWTFPGGTPNSAIGKGPHAVVYNNSGSKSAKLEITSAFAPNQIYDNSNAVLINNDTLSKADFIYGYYGKQIVGFDNRSLGSNLTYKWYFGDGDSSTERNPVHTYTNANNQTVKLIVTGNCGVDEKTIQLRDFTSLSSTSKNTISIVPNPSNGTFKFQTSYTETIVYQIFDLNGSLLLQGTSSNNQTIEAENLNSGMYFVKIFIGNNIVNLPMMVQN